MPHTAIIPALLFLVIGSTSLAASPEASTAGTPPLPPAPAPTAQLGEAQVFASEGARVQPPPGFDLAQRFAGFEQPASGAFVMVVGMDTPFDPDFLSEASRQGSDVAARSGMTYRGREAVVVGPHSGVLIHAEQAVQGMEIEKWILHVGDESRSVLVTAGCAAADAPTFEAALHATLMSTRLDDSPPPTMQQIMGFSIEAGAGLQLVDLKATGAIFADRPLPLSPGAPLFMASKSIQAVSIPDLRTYATNRLRTLPGCEGATITSSAPVTVDGISGHELEASATRNGVPSLVHMMMLPVDGGYIMTVGMVEMARADEVRPVFRAMARSLRRSDSAN
ncbi:MAG: hypothetical protein CL927_17210 [Deltaproteobacteria bacterium]|nr:hypothetical protein [Deltaproteobacteria bacterium]HCH63764.1 hypothetical protein [Deltaproteobacteria bacterium]